MILLDSVTKRYAGDARPALDDISLHIEPSEFVFLVGKSGAGKSTLIKMLTKEEIPDSGKIVIGGIDLDYVKKRHIPGYRRRLGVVFQDFKLLPRRTVYENVAFALEIIGMSGREIRHTVPKVLELVDLLDQAKKFPDQLSGGQRQRVGIARSVARQPKILIADEPTGQLDKLTTQEIIDLLKKINDFGTTILITTHNENIVNDLQKRVVTLKDGKIVDDQKNNGIYKLDETPILETQKRVLQVPGHALRQPIRLSSQEAVHPESHKVSENKPTEVKAERTVVSKKAEPRVAKVPEKKIVNIKTRSSEKKTVTRPKTVNVSSRNMQTMPVFNTRSVVKKGKIRKSSVI